MSNNSETKVDLIVNRLYLNGHSVGYFTRNNPSNEWEFVHFEFMRIPKEGWNIINKMLMDFKKIDTKIYFDYFFTGVNYKAELTQISGNEDFAETHLIYIDGVHIAVLYRHLHDGYSLEYTIESKHIREDIPLKINDFVLSLNRDITTSNFEKGGIDNIDPDKKEFIIPPGFKEVLRKHTITLKDSVNNPAHYTSGKIEVIDFIEDQKLCFHLGSALQYLVRAGKKDESKTVEDLQKAIWYITRYIQLHESINKEFNKPTDKTP